MAVLYSVFLVVCIPLCLAVGIPVVRKEVSAKAVALQPGGQLLDQRLSPQEKEDYALAKEDEGHRHFFTHRTGAECELPSLCNVNFPLGNPGSSNCTSDHPHHKIVDSPWMCEMAAEEARAQSGVNNTNASTFYITDNFVNSRPKGCFVEDNMYYFNPMALWPTGPVTGTPICYEKEFENVTDAGCPPSYDLILSENTCMEAARCSRACTSPHFAVVNENISQTLPSGCHYDPTTGCVQFNPRTTTVKNTPQLCNTTIHYPKVAAH